MTGTITATPADGYAFAGWYNGETLYSDNAELEYKSISEDLELTAQFEAEVGSAITDILEVWDDVEVVKAVIDQIAALPESNIITDAYIVKTLAAGAAFDGLEVAQQDLVPDALIAKLTACEEVLARNYADKVDDIEDITSENIKDVKAALKVAEKIEKLEDAIYISLKDEDAIRFARTAYDLLTDSQQALISKEVLTRIENAEETQIGMQDNSNK